MRFPAGNKSYKVSLIDWSNFDALRYGIYASH